MFITHYSLLNDVKTLAKVITPLNNQEYKLIQLQG